MFGDLNRVELIGNITQDIEIRHLDNGAAVTSFSLATNRRFNSNGEWKEETQFHNLVAWQTTAENIAKWCKKGTRIFVEGRLATRSWEDKNGIKQYKTEIIVSRIILLDRYNKSESESGNLVSEDNLKKTKPNKEEENIESVEEINPDDLPF